MYKLLAIFVVSLLLFACNATVHEETGEADFQVLQIHPPVYYGSEDYPESDFYITLHRLDTGEIIEKQHVSKRCNTYNDIKIGGVYTLSVTHKESMSGFIDNQFHDIKDVFCS